MRLSAATHLPPAVQQPAYDRSAHDPGIVHMGIGAFHRAHQAMYTEAVLNRFGGHWRILGVSLRSDTVQRQLKAQDCRYTVEVRNGDHRSHQVIDAIADVLVAPSAPGQVIEALASESIHVVTLTVTEKGYCLDAASGELDLCHADIAHDLAHPQQPRSAPGFLVAGLARRRQRALPGLTLISCDNVASNGSKLRSAVLSLCAQRDPSLAAWVKANCRFPSTMVDRIVPASTHEDCAQLARHLGYEDTAAVFTEPFSQWTIEQDFAGPAPPWNAVGAEYVEDVAPFETMKLRLLNASHSTIAYLGAVAGFETVADVVAEPTMRELALQLMEQEAAPTLSLPAGYAIGNYQQSLIKRFTNHALHHRCQQIAMDGSQKIPNRLIPILQWQLAHDGAVNCTTLAIAAWLRYLQGHDENGREYTIHDPLADKLSALYSENRKNRDDLIRSMLAQRDIFPSALADNKKVFTRLKHWLEKLNTAGAVATVRSLIMQS